MKLPAVLGLAFALCALPAFASEPGNLMSMTTNMHMQMPGMPAMPPMSHTQKVCVAAKRPDPRDVMRNGGQCRVTHYNVAGNTISYDVTCDAPMAISGSGKFTLLANSGIHGVIHMPGNPNGQKMQMDLTIDGTRVGSCDYTPRPSN
jgi:hypothetical protein